MKRIVLCTVLPDTLSACNTLHSAARDANTAVQAWNKDYQKQHR
ncbi:MULTISPECIES: hypothetical protein [Eikenella]|nr:MULTISPECIES: hypothetical protein [Eikenella]